MSKTKTQDFMVQDQDGTKTFIFVLEAPRDQDSGVEDYITVLLCINDWSRCRPLGPPWIDGYDTDTDSF